MWLTIDCRRGTIRAQPGERSWPPRPCCRIELCYRSSAVGQHGGPVKRLLLVLPSSVQAGHRNQVPSREWRTVRGHENFHVVRQGPNHTMEPTMPPLKWFGVFCTLLPLLGFTLY